MTPARYRYSWQKQQLSGQGGAIGYILESETAAADSRVRLIPLE